MDRLVQLVNFGRQPCADDEPSLEVLTEMWRRGRLSNLDYLLALNALAGRVPGDRGFTPMLPWVLEFTRPPEPDMDSLEVRVPEGLALPFLVFLNLGTASSAHHCEPWGCAPQVQQHPSMRCARALCAYVVKLLPSQARCTAKAPSDECAKVPSDERSVLMSTLWGVLIRCKTAMQDSAPGWRDLRRTKWRLAKGDEQLQVTFRGSHPPHHISDEALSELAVCIYQVFILGSYL